MAIDILQAGSRFATDVELRRDVIPQANRDLIDPLGAKTGEYYVSRDSGSTVAIGYEDAHGYPRFGEVLVYLHERVALVARHETKAMEPLIGALMDHGFDVAEEE